MIIAARESFAAGRFSSYKFLGRIYALRFHSRALLAAEIAANFAIDRERFGLS